MTRRGKGRGASRCRLPAGPWTESGAGRRLYVKWGRWREKSRRRQLDASYRGCGGRTRRARRVPRGEIVSTTANSNHTPSSIPSCQATAAFIL